MGVRLHCVNLLNGVLPQTRMFGVRRRLLRWAGITIGADCRINGGVVFQHSNVGVGARSWVGRRTEFVAGPSSRILIGDDCDISQDVMFVTGSHDIGPGSRRAGAGRSQDITVGAGTWVGVRSTFLAGSSVGRGCVVGAGSTVMGTFPDNVLIVGTPARIVRQL